MFICNCHHYYNHKTLLNVTLIVCFRDIFYILDVQEHISGSSHRRDPLFTVRGPGKCHYPFGQEMRFEWGKKEYNKYKISKISSNSLIQIEVGCYNFQGSACSKNKLAGSFFTQSADRPFVDRSISKALVRVKVVYLYILYESI